MNRRTFLHSSLGAAFVSALRAAAPADRRPRILLRNAWQSQNIGDIAHYLGLFELMKKFRIDAEVRLWPGNLDNGADALLAKHFPHVMVLNGAEAIAAAIKECDFFLHGSSSGFAAWKDAARWQRETGKPFGVLGISLTSTEPALMEALSLAEFVFFRDGISLEKARALGCRAPIMEFGPDTAFGVVSLRNDALATAFLRAHGLEDGKFMCCIPRYRWTPFWTIHQGRTVDEKKAARNRAMKEQDHAPLRAAITAVTRETQMKVLVTCEDQTQIALGKEMLIDPLPDDVKSKVVWRDRYWLPDEALSTYVRSAGLFGNEMHSPIMCIASAIPAVVCRFDEQTQKGFMWRDLGLNDWLFNLDAEDEVARIPPTVLAIAQDPVAARAKAANARALVQRLQRKEMEALATALR
ncbi:MAG TPA: polysaccharide pyruvyl transferase family protein [Chthoniobacteraceae bacterium]|nr:polysaccharide pyruvyl transferase family protein [Chthoniobacteraceae bacterium]